MPEPKKDLLEELAELGLEDEWIDRIRDWNSASPLRKVANSQTKRAETAEAENTRLRGIVLKATFKDAGLKIDPSLLNLPTDLDFSDVSAVSKWAVDSGLKEAAPDTDPGELEAHEAINEINSGGEPPSSSVLTPLVVSEWSADKWAKFTIEHPEAAEQLKRGEEVRNVSTK